MNQHSDIPTDLQLIGRYLSGEASPEEALAIDRWREAAPQNNDLFESAARLWDESSAKKGYLQPDSADQWLKLKDAVDKTREEPTIFIYRKILTHWKVAATILLIIGFTLLYYLPWPHTAPSTYSKVISSKESIVTDTLRDFSVITLSRHSNLSIHRQFAQTGREVNLKGEGYFSVKQLSDQPFTIYAGGIEIIVMGTEFNVKDAPEAVTVSVKSGAVKMKKDSSGIVITAGSTGVFNKQENRFALYPDSLNRNNYGYASRELYFYNATLEEVKEALKNTYGVQVVFENKALSGLRINTQFKKQRLDYVLEVISASLDIQYRREGHTIYFLENEPR